MRQSAFIAAPSYSLFDSSSSEILPGPKKGSFGGGVGYSIAYYFPKTMSLGASIEYALISGNFYSDCYCGHPLDRTVSIRNNISTHSFDIPFYVNFRTNRNENQFLYLKSGIGSSILISAYRIVEREVDLLGRVPIERTEIESGYFRLKNENNNVFGSFFLIAMGHTFKIINLNLYSELLFRQDINFWNYQTVETPDGIKQIQFKRQSFILKTCILF